MHRIRCLIGAAIAVASFAASTPAVAHQSPAGCNTSGVNMQMGGNIGGILRNGDKVKLTPTIRNDANNVCDVTDATIVAQFPAADGSPNGPEKVVATGVNLPAGTPPTALPLVEHTIDFNPGVFRGEVKLKLSGTFHWIGTHNPGPMGSSGRDAVISRPHATITVTPAPAMGDAPLAVTYSYAVKNDSPEDPAPGDTSPSIRDITLTDDRCGTVPPSHTGDTNSNGVMETTETWTYTCTTTLPGGTFTNNVSMEAISARDGRPWPATTGQGTVTVNGPDMTLAKSHTGDFRQGDNGRAYSLVAKNSGNRASTGAVSVADTLPQGLTATAISGQGWDCTLATLTCTRSDALPAGESYPPITVTVDVAADAPASVTNTAAVSRSGENTANDGASDPTAIGPPEASKPADGGTSDPGTSDPGTVDPVTPRDLTAPAFSGLRLTNRTFAVDAKTTSRRVSGARARKGTAFAYTLSEAASVTVTVERKTAGRRSGRDCVKETKRNRKAKRCSRYVPLGSFTQDAAAGQNMKRWAGRVGARFVKPGTYRAAVVATDAAGNKSTVRRLGFKVVRR